MLEARLAGGPEPDVPNGGGLGVPRGEFVTLRAGGELRGCIGHVPADRPLVDVVAQMAVAAGLEDPRFPPVSATELAAVRIEISAVTELVRVAQPDPGSIVPGRDGLIVRQGVCQGLLLPQVATECGWDGEALLAATCCKAGLSPDAWREPGIELYAFQAEVFSE